MKRILAGLMCMMIALSLCDCTHQKEDGEYYMGFKIREDVDFRYLLFDEVCPTCKSVDHPHVAIWDLTETGKEKEILIIPKTINGYEVRHLGLESFPIWVTYQLGEIRSVNVRRIYLLKPVECFADLSFFHYFYSNEDGEKHSITPNLERIIFNYITDGGEYGGGYVTYDKFLNSNKIIERENVSYWIGEEKPYWIDDFEYGEKITYIPEEPKRDGFEFVGWFKEEDCLNEWNFETDTLPKAQKMEDGEDFYAETKLYANWIKK